MTIVLRLRKPWFGKLRYPQFIGCIKRVSHCSLWCLLLSHSVQGILQGRLLEWVAMPSSRGSSQPRDWTRVSYMAGRFFFFFKPLRHQGSHWSLWCLSFLLKDPRILDCDSGTPGPVKPARRKIEGSVCSRALGRQVCSSHPAVWNPALAGMWHSLQGWETK